MVTVTDADAASGLVAFTIVAAVATVAEPVAATSFEMSADADVEAIAEPDAARSLDSDADAVMPADPAVVAARGLTTDATPLADDVTDEDDATINATAACRLDVMLTAPDAESPFDSDTDADDAMVTAPVLASDLTTDEAPVTVTVDADDEASCSTSDNAAVTDTGHDTEEPNSTCDDVTAVAGPLTGCVLIGYAFNVWIPGRLSVSAAPMAFAFMTLLLSNTGYLG